MKGLKFKSCSSSNSHEPRHKWKREVYNMRWVARFWSSTNVQLNNKSSFFGRSSSLVLVGCVCSFSQSVLSLLHGVAMANRLETHTARNCYIGALILGLSLMDLKQEWRDMTRQTRQNKISRISFRRRWFRQGKLSLYLYNRREVEKDKGEGKEKDNDYHNYKRHERRQK